MSPDNIPAPQTGTVRPIDYERIARIAHLPDAPLDKGAGIDLAHKTGGQVRAGRRSYRIYASSQTGLGFARDLSPAHYEYEITE